MFFVSCGQNKSPNDADKMCGAIAPTYHAQTQETPQPSYIPLIDEFSKNADVVGYALSHLSKEGFIVSDLFGIKIGQNYIDDVGNLSISGEQISELFDKDYFLDNLADVNIDDIENCNVYLINNATIIKGNIEQTDVFLNTERVNFL